MDTQTDSEQAGNDVRDAPADEQFIVGILVNNHFGVLNRVAGLYAKRCYNIESLAVGETENPQLSRMTIVSRGSRYMQDQVVKQLRKLHDVKAVLLFDKDTTTSVEHVLVKLDATSSKSADVSGIIERFGGKVKDFSDTSVLVEITGEAKKIEAFFEAISPLGVIESCRSGLISMAHGFDHTLGVPRTSASERTALCTAGTRDTVNAE